MMNGIGDKQIQLINRIKFFLEKLSSSNVDLSLSSFCYFSPSGETLGYAKLKHWLNGWSFAFKFCSIFFKNILAIASHTNYIEFNKRDSSNNYDTIVLSWCLKNNFQSDGSFNDRYFNENSKDLPNSYWILISADDYIPENLKNNITIIKRKHGIFKYNIISFIKILLCIIIDCKFSLKKMYHYVSFHSFFAKTVFKIVKKELKKGKCKVILTPYEGQPFQNYIYLEAKKIDKKIKTVGYVHSVLNALPSDLIYRSGAPDMLLVHGQSQIDILESKLNWKKEQLSLVDSLRYRINQSKSLSNKIFLPLVIVNSNLFINEFKKILIQSPINSLPKLNIQNHPTTVDSKKHLDLKRKLEEIMKNYDNRFSITPLQDEVSIFFGVTAAIIEALEKNIKTIHICSDPILESYSEKIWPNLKVEQLSNYVFRYKLTLTGTNIIFGKKNKVLYEILKKDNYL